MLIGINSSFEVEKTIKFNVVIKRVNKNLVDNVNIFNTDSAFVMDAITLSCNPDKSDIIQIDNKTFKIVSITPLGVIDNQPTAYEITIRLA